VNTREVYRIQGSADIDVTVFEDSVPSRSYRLTCSAQCPLPSGLPHDDFWGACEAANAHADWHEGR
jgi:hypothetical protein